jgi:hypothetical protein
MNPAFDRLKAQLEMLATTDAGKEYIIHRWWACCRDKARPTPPSPGEMIEQVLYAEFRKDAGKR